MKLSDNYVGINLDILKVILDATPTSITYVTRTYLDKLVGYFAIMGIECESDEDIYTMLKLLADEGLVTLVIGSRNRVEQIKRKV